MEAMIWRRRSLPRGGSIKASCMRPPFFRLPAPYLPVSKASCFCTTDNDQSGFSVFPFVCMYVCVDVKSEQGSADDHEMEMKLDLRPFGPCTCVGQVW